MTAVMNTDPKKPKIVAGLAGVLKAQAEAAIPPNLDLLPALRQALEQRREQAPRYEPYRQRQVQPGRLFQPADWPAGDVEWMEEALEPNQVWIELRGYRGHAEEAAQALRDAFAAAGIADQLHDVILSPDLSTGQDDQQVDFALSSRPAYWEFDGTLMARVEKTDAAAAVLRNGPPGSSDLAFGYWQFAKNMSRPRERAGKDEPREIPFKMNDIVTIQTWPFNGFLGKVSGLHKSKGQVLVMPFDGGRVKVTSYSVDELELKPEEPKRAWYVLYTYPGKEGLLRDRLRNRLVDARLHYRLFDIVIPGEGQNNIALVKDNQVQTISPTLFPGALFVLVSLDETTWDVIRQTPGLTGFVGQGSTPQGYPPAQPPAAVTATAPGAPIQKGDRVRILSGPYLNFRGAVIEVDAAQAQVHVMVDFPGHPVKALLRFDQVEKETI